MEDTKGKILQFIQGKGPVLPADIARHISSNILMASAHLSELSSKGTLKISNVKVGGSPLYYIPGQESQLQNFADNLHEKEKKAYDILSQKKILNDSNSEPVIRVALRAIKDYAVPLQVNFKGSSEIFWKWYLLTNKEAEELIRQSIKETQPHLKTQPSQEQLPSEKIEETQVKKTIEKEKLTNQEIQKKIQPLPEKTKAIETPIKQEKKKKPVKTDHNEFLNTISNYFNRNKINTLSKEIIRKTEIDFLIQVPSAVGTLEYYCKAKNKKKINDADLASAFAQGQLRKLPVLIITNGELTKRAKEMLQKDFKGIGIKHL